MTDFKPKTILIPGYLTMEDAMRLDAEINAAQVAAYVRGAEKMRERAAQEMDNVLDLRMDELVAAKRQIRALPIHAEQKDGRK